MSDKEKAMEEMAQQMQQAIASMTPEERRQRAGNLKNMLDVELKRREMGKSNKGGVLKWLVSHWKDD
jgi:hypothetical protein